jgi:rod shape-determining protein MreC
VAFRQDPFGELKVPLTWTAAVALIVCVVIGAALLLSDRRETLEEKAYPQARAAVDVAASKANGVVAAPTRWAGDFFGAIGSYFFAASENRRLKKELLVEQGWHDKAVALQDENERLRAMLGVKTNPPIPMITAYVVADSRGPYANARLADAGKEAGVQIGFPVISERGLVGRVVGVAPGASRILLLTDVISRTPVMIDRTNARAILTGDGGPNPKLEYLRGRDPVREGDRVLTSGDGGVIPRGLPVGRAVKGLDGAWRVVLDSDSQAIDWVRILKFTDYSQLVNQQALSASTLPPVITEDPQARIVPETPKPSVDKPAQKPSAATTADKPPAAKPTDKPANTKPADKPADKPKPAAKPTTPAGTPQ